MKKLTKNAPCQSRRPLVMKPRLRNEIKSSPKANYADSDDRVQSAQAKSSVQVNMYIFVIIVFLAVWRDITPLRNNEPCLCYQLRNLHRDCNKMKTVICDDRRGARARNTQSPKAPLTDKYYSYATILKHTK